MKKIRLGQKVMGILKFKLKASDKQAKKVTTLTQEIQTLNKQPAVTPQTGNSEKSWDEKLQKQQWLKEAVNSTKNAEDWDKLTTKQKNEYAVAQGWKDVDTGSPMLLIIIIVVQTGIFGLSRSPSPIKFLFA